MKSDLHLEMVAERYARMSDEELIGQVTLNAAGMTPEAIAIANKEIAARRLNPGLTKAIAAQNEPLTEDIIIAYCDLISKQSCPRCGGHDRRLNGTETIEIRGIILFTIIERRLTVACPPCLNKKLFSAIASSLLMGLGSPFHMIRSLFINLGNLRSPNRPDHNKYLREFAAQNRGVLAMMKEKDFDWSQLNNN